MPYVQRDTNGKVTGRYARPQPGYAEEWLADGHVDLMPSTEELAAIAAREAQAAADAQAIADAKADAVVQQLVNHSPTQIMQYVRNQVNANGVTNLATAKASIDALETMVAKLAVALGAALRDKLR